MTPVSEPVGVKVSSVVDSSAGSRKRPDGGSGGQGEEGQGQSKRIKEEAAYAENEPSSTWSHTQEREVEVEDLSLIEEGQTSYTNQHYTGYESEMVGYEDVQNYGNEVGEWKIQHPLDPVTDRFNKAYQCEMCSMSFAQKWLLKRHWKTHTGEKPYKCSLCLKSFSLRDSCQRHLKTVHKEVVQVNSLPGQEDISSFIEVENQENQ